MTPPSGEGAEPTPYQRFGGHEFFTNLVHNFYQRVPKDPVLREMYPSQDLEGAEWRLRAFLEQYWGGPETYSEERGHPRLRMRHIGFHIDGAARDRWLSLMAASIADQGMDAQLESELWKYFVAAAFGMQNVPDPTPESPVTFPITSIPITSIPNTEA
ncbi:MAG: globin [Candidatus Nanopelagicales bacterium]